MVHAMFLGSAEKTLLVPADSPEGTVVVLYQSSLAVVAKTWDWELPMVVEVSFSRAVVVIPSAL